MNTGIQYYECLNKLMERGPSWEANNHSVSQESLPILWNLKVHCDVHKIPPLVTILSQTHSVHIFPPCFPNIHSNIISPFTSMSSKWSLHFRFSNKNFVYVSHLSHVCYMPDLSHPPWRDHPNNIWWSVHVMKFLIMQSSPASHHFLPLTYKCFQHPVLIQLQFIFFPSLMNILQ
jgi:hypothetical protein